MINYKKIIWGNGANNLNEIPKKIWIYWDGDSELVNICIKNIKHYLSSFEINILNKISLRDYLPNILNQRNDLPLANYTDLIRLELLNKYGGIWLDASILITENFNWLFKLKKESHTDLIGFYSDYCTTDYNYPIFENWFLASSKQNIFIKNWLDEYKKCYISDHPKNYYLNIKSNPSLIQNIGEFADYLLPYLSAIKIMRESNNYKILMISANETGHRYNFGSDLNYQEFINLFLNSKPPTSFPMLIKFEKSGRNLLDEKLKIGKFKKSAFLIKISQEETIVEKIKRATNYFKFIVNNYYNKLIKK